jgi:hypothetical protein
VVSDEAYEKYQLELILREYEGRGFDVLREAQAGLGNMRFDAIAKNRSSGQLVIIELVNKAQSRARAAERINVIRRLAESYPDAQIDLRYIDVEKSRIHWWQDTVGGDRYESIEDAINKRLPRRPKDALGWTMYFMQIWALHTATIRAYGRIIDLLTAPPIGRGALEVYNDLLRFELLLPPEDLIEGVDLNLFDLHEAVLAIADGAIVNERYLDNLVQHFYSVRQQVRKRMKPMQIDLPQGE